MQNQINSLLSPSYSWSRISSTIPSRWGHTLVYIRNFLVVFGGYSGQYLSDLWVFNLESHIWSNLTIPNNPEARSHHSAISLSSSEFDMKDPDSFKQKIIIYAGKGKNSKILGDLFELDWEKKRWKSFEMKESVGPGKRNGHSANLLLNQYMVVFGGENIRDLNDLWIMDVKTHKWKMGELNGKAPKGRKFHTAAVVQNKFYIVGGCYDNYISLG